MKALKIALGACAAAMVAAPAMAGTVDLGQYYFVRPYIAAGDSTIDGLQENGPTSASQSLTSDYSSSVDLATGKIRTYLDTSGAGAFAQTVGVFGDTLNFTGGDGSLVDFTFDFDGIINASAPDQDLNSTLQYGVSATLYVFDASSDATATNYTSKSGPLISQSAFLNFVNPDEAIDQYLSHSLSGSIAVTGAQSYKVFASLGTFAALNDNTGSVTMDFTHTGSIGLQTPTGVSYTSASGAFLTGAAVPEPGAWALMILGFGGAGGMLRRRRPAHA